MTVEERDARTVFCMQLSQRIRPRDLEEFFSAVGKVIQNYLKFVFILFLNCVLEGSRCSAHYLQQDSSIQGSLLCRIC